MGVGGGGGAEFADCRNVGKVYIVFAVSTGCGGVRNAISDGEISSQNYPQNYPRNSNCTWLITSDLNSEWIGFQVEIYMCWALPHKPMVGHCRCRN